jgi:2-polyprenyl-3-methyl-5-hydroxy-6-metoxy-1,4-benzoquinol methylase
MDIHSSPPASEPCLLCGALAPRVATAARRPLHTCPVCGLTFVPAAGHVSMEDERARYLLHRNTREDAGYVRFLMTAVGALERRVPAATGPLVLDYGCGPTPVLVELLRERGYAAEGYDPFFAPRGADLTRAYEVVMATETAEHFRRPAAEFERIVRLVRPGGILIVLTALTDVVTDFARWHYALDSTHVAFYSLKTFAWLAARHRLTMIETNGHNLVMLGRTPEE